jgi:16S rRNA (cytosine1402-N4)-methyltransferase
MDQPTTDVTSNHGYHRPVMVDRVVSLLEPAATGWILDATYGGGGHSRALRARYRDARIVAVDRDPDAVAQGGDGDHISVVRGNFRDIADILDAGPWPDRMDGVLFDLGVSSHQLDRADRGFSYHRPGPLDMRMGPDAPRSAGELIDDSGIDELTAIIRRYGEERFARRIAAAIVEHRPFTTTTELAACIADAVPAPARRGKHPARRTFQALRIAVNDELTSIDIGIESAIDRLVPGGRIVVLAYHSLEDRIVKGILRERSRTCSCDPALPECRCGASPDLVLIHRKVIRATEAEVAENPRARSAVLRVAERSVA